LTFRQAQVPVSQGMKTATMPPLSPLHQPLEYILKPEKKANLGCFVQSSPSFEYQDTKPRSQTI